MLSKEQPGRIIQNSMKIELEDLTTLSADDKATKSNKDKLKEELKKWDADMIFSNALESFMRNGFNKTNFYINYFVESFEKEVESSTRHFSPSSIEKH